jgi:hypothetical protein
MKRNFHAFESGTAAAVCGCRSSLVVPALALVIALSSCAHPRPKVLDVEGTQYKETISRADRNLFGPDRASHLRVDSTALPDAQQREEYYVAWRGTGITEVKFEYRQVNIPNKILVQTFAPAGKQWTIFKVIGDEFINGGPISAWRVSLWDGDRLLAERKSVLW